jgi:hypothetical protein
MDEHHSVEATRQLEEAAQRDDLPDRRKQIKKIPFRRNIRKVVHEKATRK